MVLIDNSFSKEYQTRLSEENKKIMNEVSQRFEFVW